MKSKKSQSAMEFLSTYGWAFLVFIIVIASLVYTGVLHPNRFLPDHIDFGPGIRVPDYSITFFDDYGINIGHFIVFINNGLGSRMRDVTLTIRECENNNGKSSSPINIMEGDTEKIVLTCENIKLIEGDNPKLTAVLKYNILTDHQTLSHSRTASMKITPRRMNQFPDNNLGRRAWALENGASGLNDENRFFPCDDVENCNSQDAEGILKKIFGGYVDSMTGKVWLSYDAPEAANYTWGIKNETPVAGLPQWDKVQPRWNFITKEYDYYNDSLNLNFKNDKLGTAFDYCINLIEYNRKDWKLPSLNDFNGLLNCNKCLPPLTTYPIIGFKYYWTDKIYLDGGHDDGEFVKCIEFSSTEGGSDKCSKSAKLYVRCIRDNPE